MTDIVWANNLKNTPAKVESQLHGLEQAAAIGTYVNTKKNSCVFNKKETSQFYVVTQLYMCTNSHTSVAISHILKMISEYTYVIHPFGRPEYINFLKPILFMARDSSSGFQQGHHTFLYGHKKYNRGSGRKRTNEQYRLRSAPSARGVVLWHFFVQLFFLTIAWSVFFAKLQQKPLRMPSHFWLSSFTASFCWPSNTGLLTHLDWVLLLPFSTASLRLSSPTDCLWDPLPTAPLASLGPHLTPLSVSSEISSPSPLFGFVPKQTEGSSAWLTTHIMSHVHKVLKAINRFWIE